MTHKVAYIFPGQGSQYIGMGRELALAHPEVAEIFAEASALTGRDLPRLCFEGLAEELARTENAQPAIFTLSRAIAAVLAAEGLSPHMAAGHSLGEYSALCAAGVLDYAAGLALVSVRARLMEEASRERPGVMFAALGAPDDLAERLKASFAGRFVAEAANYNCPGQVIVSVEERGAVEVAMWLAEHSKKAVKLDVRGAFHSSLMEGAALRFAEHLLEVPFSDARIPVVSNSTAKPATNAGVLSAALITQMTSPVLWSQSVERMLAEGVSAFVEIGPGQVIGKLIRRISGEALVLATESPALLSEAVAALRAG